MLNRLRKMGSFALLLAIVGLLPLVSSGADAERIQKLINQLGSEQFRVREYATKELDTIGEPALAAIEVAMKSEDMEVRRRATELHQRISKRSVNSKRLAPTLVELSFQDKPLNEVVAELSKKSGYTIVLQGDANEFARRRLTLETGKVPFWQALDMICEKAELVEADGQPVASATPNPADQPILIAPIIRPLPVRVPAKPQPAPAVPMKEDPAPANDAPKQGARKNAPKAVPAIAVAPVIELEAVPVPAPKVVPAKVQPAVPMKNDAAPAKEEPKQGAKKPLPQAMPPAVQVQVQIQGGIQIAQPVQIQLQAVDSVSPAIQPGQPNRTITLTDAKGKSKSLPTHYEGAVRIRALPPERAKAFPIDGNLVIALQATPEPKIQWQNLVGYKIDKAIDDQGQDLPGVSGAMAQNDANQNADTVIVNNGQVIRIMRGRQIGMVNPGMVPGNQPFAIRLKKAEKESSVIKELAGTITAQIRTPPEALASINDVLKAKPVSVPGKDGCSLKLLKFEKTENGDYLASFELSYSTEIVPGFAPAQPATAARGNTVNNYLGLMLADANGKRFDVSRVTPRQQHYSGKSVTVTGEVGFRAMKDSGEPAQFSFHGTTLSLVDVPFVLKDVPVK